MAIDSSAFVAIVAGEPERRIFSEAISAEPTRLTSAATLLETTMIVLGRKGEAGLAAFMAFIEAMGIETVAFTAEQLALAVTAFRRFGKGTPPRRAQFRRLLLLCSFQDDGRASALQGPRLFPDRYRAGPMITFRCRE